LNDVCGNTQKQKQKEKEKGRRNNRK